MDENKFSTGTEDALWVTFSCSFVHIDDDDDDDDDDNNNNNNNNSL